MFRIILLLLPLYLIDQYASAPDSAKIKQSNQCTSEEIENNIQCFQEVPKDKYEVTLGSSVTLRCIVRNQHGKVQWRAFPVLLGYDRNIPGRARYRYVGSVVKGEHHLEIQDVIKADAGFFECQVQPVGERHPLLRRKTELIVLVRPSDPQILYLGVEPANGQVIIHSGGQKVRSIFICISFNGQPDPTFKWLKNSVEIRNGVDSALIEGEKNHKSTLSYLTQRLADGDFIKCRVSNRATEKHHDPEKRYLEKKVVIILQTTPGQPQIPETTCDRRETFSEGDIFRCTCVARPGKPQGSIMWRWKLPISRELHNFQREDTTVRDVSLLYYTQQINERNLISKIELPPLTSQYHGAQLFCIAINPVTAIEYKVLTFKINYPPSAVYISTSDGSLVTREIDKSGVQETVILGQSGEEKSITCSTAPHYSAAEIKWIFHYNPLTAQAYHKKMSFVPKELVWNDGDSYRRNSTINITIDKKLDKSYIDCQAWSAGKRVDARVKLDVIYPPERPIITGYKISSPVKVNNFIDLTCSTTGGNPLPNLQWYKDNDAIDIKYSADRIGNQKILKLRLTASKEQNNNRYFCQAKSDSFNKRPLNSEEFRPVVYFPPDDVTLSSLSGSEVEEGNIVILQCIAGESNPPAVIRWKINRCGQMMTELGRRSPPKNCNEKMLSSSSQSLLPGKFGGKKLKSKIEIRTTWKDHMDYVDCEVFNPEYGIDVFVLRKRLQLNVTFSPKFEDIVNPYIVIEENKTQTFNFEPIANPPVLRYEWFKGSLLMQSSSSSVSGVKSLFIIKKASKIDMGNYTLLAINDRGEERVYIFLNITYSPIILGPSIETVYGIRQNAELECSVKSNPADPIHAYKWVKQVPQRGLNDISNSSLITAFSIGCNRAERIDSSERSSVKYFSKCNSKSQFEMSSSLVVYDLDRNDVGIYTCIVDNRVGFSVRKTFELIKFFTPQILAIPKFAKAAGRQGDMVTISCYIRAEPQPAMVWTFGRYNFTIKGNYKYKLMTSKIRIGLYKAELRLVSIQRSDHGRYFCKAENEMGSDIRFIDVSGSSIPDVPLEIQVVNKTLNSITVSWMQGFDGGSPQTFQVRWKENKKHSLYRYEDVAADDTKTTLDFIIKGLSSDSVYRVSINSRNSIHGKSAYSGDIIVSTYSTSPDLEQTSNGFRPTSEDNKLQDNTVLFIVAASVFGFVIFVVNVLVIIFVLKRRRQRSRTAKFEARYNDPKSLLAASNGLILSRDDHQRDPSFIRSDAVELYPRGLDSSKSSHHPHHLHSQRRSIPDDQNTFSTFESASDNAREDLLRRQKEFGCCAINPKNKKRPIFLGYEPLTNVAYFAPVSNSSTPIFIQPGIYDQDTLSTLLSPIHEGNQRQLVSFRDITPYNAQRDSSSCGSVNSVSGCSVDSHPHGNYVNNISPCGSINATDSKYVNYHGSNYAHPGLLNGAASRHWPQNIGPQSSGAHNNAPYRARVVSPTFIGYGMTPQQRDSYASELRKAQLSGNIIINPAMFNKNTVANPQVNVSQIPEVFVSTTHSSEPFVSNVYDSCPQPSQSLTNIVPSIQRSDHATTSAADHHLHQKYQCNDNKVRTANSIENVSPSINFANSSMEDSTHIDFMNDFQYLPRPDLI